MQANPRTVCVLATGGTIAGVAASPDDDTRYVAGVRPVEQLLAVLPFVPEGVVLQHDTVAAIDSKDLDFAVWQRLAARLAQAMADPAVQGVVVTHGTDTLEETAYLLHAVAGVSKPVVLTGAMRPATAREPDGPRNLADAIALAARPGLRGVWVVFAGDVHAAETVFKRHSQRLDAFASAETGPWGRIDGGSLISQKNLPEVSANAGFVALEDIAAQGNWPRVEIVLNHAGARGDTVRALVKDGVQGLVVAGTGSGTLHHDLEAALREAAVAGVPVVRASRCLWGGVREREDDPFGSAGALSPVKARIALMLALMRPCGRNP